MRRFLALVAAAQATTSSAAAGAWSQDQDYGFALNQSGYALADSGEGRLLFDGYGEAGVGDGLTVVFAFDGDLDQAASQYVWRGGAGLRFSFALDGAPGWTFSVEGAVRYQGHEAVIVDPVFAGDGLGGALRLDAGHSLELFDRHVFANLGVSYTYRRLAPGETKLEFVSGIDLGPSWQMGLGYTATFAPGEFYDPGAYEKHEAQAWLRWRIDRDYALSLSVTQTLAADRAPSETALRVGLWTFFYPEDGGD